MHPGFHSRNGLVLAENISGAHGGNRTSGAGPGWSQVDQSLLQCAVEAGAPILYPPAEPGTVHWMLVFALQSVFPRVSSRNEEPVVPSSQVAGLKSNMLL